MSLDEQPLQSALRGLAGMLLAEQDPETMLASVTTLAAGAVGRCDVASISLPRNGRPTTPVSSAGLATEVDEAQY